MREPEGLCFLCAPERVQRGLGWAWQTLPGTYAQHSSPSLLKEPQFSPPVNVLRSKMNHDWYKSLMLIYSLLPVIGLGVDI